MLPSIIRKGTERSSYNIAPLRIPIFFEILGPKRPKKRKKNEPTENIVPIEPGLR